MITPTQHATKLHPVGDPGTVVIAWREGGRWRQEPVAASDLPDAVKELAHRPDAYISQNRFYGPRRRIAHLAQMGALFADLDFYNIPELQSASPWRVLDEALYLLDLERMPNPSLAISTGRGLALIWLHRPIPRQALPRWNACQQALYDALKPLGADPMAKDAARCLRLVGTVNSKNDKVVECLTATGEPWDFDDLADEILPLTRAELHDLRIQRALRRKVNLPRPHTPAGFNASTLWEARLSDLQQWRELRYNGPLPPGERNSWVFFASSGMAWLAEPFVLEREIVALAAESASWSESEARSRMCSVLARAQAAARGEKIAFNGREIDMRYRLTNKLIIDALGITASEQREMRTLIGPDERRKRNRERMEQTRRDEGMLKREDYLTEVDLRRQMALEMRDTGKSASDIAQALNVHRSSVYRYLAD